jgi:hypothetical protein
LEDIILKVFLSIVVALMLHLMNSLLGIVEMMLLKDLIRHGGGNLSLLKREKEEEEALILVMIVTLLFKCS